MTARPPSTVADAIEGRVRIVEDGALVDADDLRRMLGVLRALAAQAAMRETRTSTGDMGEVRRRLAGYNRIVAIEGVLFRGDERELDRLLAPPPHQEIKP